MTAIDRTLAADIDRTLTDFAERLTLLCFRRRRIMASDRDPLLNELEHLQAAAEQIRQRFPLSTQTEER